MAKAQAEVARAHKEDLRRQLEFAEQVKDKRAISQEELTRRSSAVETAEAELQEKEVQVQSAESQLHAVEVELERSIVRSPIEAEVLQVKIVRRASSPPRVRRRPRPWFCWKIETASRSRGRGRARGPRLRPGARAGPTCEGTPVWRLPLALCASSRSWSRSAL